MFSIIRNHISTSTLPYHWGDYTISQTEKEQLQEILNQRFSNNWYFCCDDMGISQYHDSESDSESEYTADEVRQLQDYRMRTRLSVGEERTTDNISSNDIQIINHDVVPLNQECPICFESVNEATTLSCRHQYHSHCINNWAVSCINNRREVTCASCRTLVNFECT